MGAAGYIFCTIKKCFIFATLTAFLLEIYFPGCKNVARDAVQYFGREIRGTSWH